MKSIYSLLLLSSLPVLQHMFENYCNRPSLMKILILQQGPRGVPGAVGSRGIQGAPVSGLF